MSKEYIYKPYSSLEDFKKDLDGIFNKPRKPYYISYIGKYVVEADNYEYYIRGCLEAMKLLENNYESRNRK